MGFDSLYGMVIGFYLRWSRIKWIANRCDVVLLAFFSLSYKLMYFQFNFSWRKFMEIICIGIDSLLGWLLALLCQSCD